MVNDEPFRSCMVLSKFFYLIFSFSSISVDLLVSGLMFGIKSLPKGKALKVRKKKEWLIFTAKKLNFLSV